MATHQYTMATNSSMTLPTSQPSASMAQNQPMGTPRYCGNYGQTQSHHQSHHQGHHQGPHQGHHQGQQFTPRAVNPMLPMSSAIEANCMSSEIKSTVDMNDFPSMAYGSRTQPPHRVPLCASTPVPDFVSSSGMSHRLANNVTPPLPNSPHKGLLNPSLSAYHRSGSDCSLSSVKSNGSCSSVRSDPGHGNNNTNSTGTNRKQVLPKEVRSLVCVAVMPGKLSLPLIKKTLLSLGPPGSINTNNC